MFLTSLENVLLLLLMAVPGFIVAKTKLINKENTVSAISVILLYICQPFVTFNSFLNTEYSGSVFLNCIFCFVFTAFLMVIMSALGSLTFWKLEPDKDRRGLFAYGGAYGNIGYLCIPFLQILVPENSEILIYASSAIAAFNITSWTLGSFLLTGEKKYMSLKKAILNPATLSVILVLPLFLLNINFIRFPKTAGLQKIVAFLSNMVAPLAMILLGVKLSDLKVKETFTDYKTFISIALKLVISPLVSFALISLASLFFDTDAVKLNLIALAAMPAANNLIMFTSLYEKDTALGAKIIMLSTLISILTIPLSLELLM